MKIIVAFSGGRTSAYMGWWLKHHTDHELKFVFMNTGCEHEETLKFLDECDRRWNLDLIWLEVSVNESGYGRGFGSSYKQVDFKTASRNGEPFESAIRKYGIPNIGSSHCSGQLKTRPLDKYIKENGLSDWLRAIGIRADEVDRINPEYKKMKYSYPLISMHPTTEDNIMHWWRKQEFDLGLEQFQGNCTWCWKKSFRKLGTIAKQMPEVYDFPKRMEEQYRYVKTDPDTPRLFFRGNRTTQDILDMAKDTIPFNPSPVTQPDMFWDETGGCSESCEVFS